MDRRVSNPVIPISTFNDVVLSAKKPLILCDIDDTIIGYKKNYTFFYTQVKEMVEIQKSAHSGPQTSFRSIMTSNKAINMTEPEIRNAAANLYENYRQTSRPKHCDFNGFNDLVKRASNLGGELQFLTARGRQATFFTKMQFAEIGITYSSYPVHYTGGIISKGEYITKYIDLNQYGEVIFIDDLDNYIKTVVELCPYIQCYKFEYKP